jgi:hypothetical protein
MKLRFPPDQQLPERSEEFAHARCQVIGVVGKYPGQVCLECADAMSNSDAEFDAKCPYLVGQLGLAADKPVVYAVHRLKFNLFGGFGLYKAHRRPSNGFGDGRSVDQIVFVGLDVGLTNCAGMMRTVCPSVSSFLASHWDPGHASIPMSALGALEKNVKIVARLSVARWSWQPEESVPTTWNVFLPRSMP